MIEIFDKQRRRVAIAENAHAISEQKRINAVWYLYFSLPYKDPKNEYCKPFYYVRQNGGELYRIMPETLAVDEAGSVAYQCEHVLATLIDNILFGYIRYEEEIDMSREELKALIRETVREVLNEENPVYKDLKDVPEYWKPTAAALLDAGAVNGGTSAEVCATDLNLRKETLKAVVVAAAYHDAREGKQ